MKQPGKGSTRRSSVGSPANYAGWRRIMVAFDEETFAIIRDRAVRSKTSFAEQVRLLTEWGLETEEMVQEKAA